MENPAKSPGILHQILQKYEECKDNSFLKLATYHLGVYEKYLKLIEEKGQAAFPNRLEYQKFQVAKLFIDKLDLLECSLDPSLKGFKEYKDSTLPPLDAFQMTPDVIETRKIKFCQNIDKGDVLHLKVVEEANDEYKLLVMNKYNENERVADYFIYAYMMKSYQLNKLPRPLRINDCVRAAVLGKLKMEGKCFSKLLVTLNDNIVSNKYEDIHLGLIHESEIPFYPDDISSYSSFLSYMKANETPYNPEDIIKCMTSLGIDPYKIYSFHELSDGKKLGKPKEPSNIQELEKMKESMNKTKEADREMYGGEGFKIALPLLEEAIKIYPKNDAAYAVRAQLYRSMFLNTNNIDYIPKILKDLEKSLSLNTYNLTATREYLTLLMLSAELYKGDGNKAKADKIMKIILRYKDVYDVTTVFTSKTDEEKESQ